MSWFTDLFRRKEMFDPQPIGKEPKDPRYQEFWDSIPWDDPNEDLTLYEPPMRYHPEDTAPKLPWPYPVGLVQEYWTQNIDALQESSGIAKKDPEPSLLGPSQDAPRTPTGVKLGPPSAQLSELLGSLLYAQDQERLEKRRAHLVQQATLLVEVGQQILASLSKEDQSTTPERLDTEPA